MVYPARPVYIGLQHTVAAIWIYEERDFYICQPSCLPIGATLSSNMYIDIYIHLFYTHIFYHQGQGSLPLRAAHLRYDGNIIPNMWRRN